MTSIVNINRHCLLSNTLWSKKFLILPEHQTWPQCLQGSFRYSFCFQCSVMYTMFVFRVFLIGPDFKISVTPLVSSNSFQICNLSLLKIFCWSFFSRWNVKHVNMQHPLLVNKPKFHLIGIISSVWYFEFYTFDLVTLNFILLIILVNQEKTAKKPFVSI